MPEQKCTWVWVSFAGFLCLLGVLFIWFFVWGFGCLVYLVQLGCWFDYFLNSIYYLHFSPVNLGSEILLGFYLDKCTDIL